MKAVVRPSKGRNVYCITTPFAQFHKVQMHCNIQKEYTFKVITNIYDGDSISKLQIVIEKTRMEIMTYKQHLFFNIISIQI